MKKGPEEMFKLVNWEEHQRFLNFLLIRHRLEIFSNSVSYLECDRRMVKLLVDNIKKNLIVNKFKKF